MDCERLDCDWKLSSVISLVVRMLAVIVFVFMATWMPYRTMVVYNSIAESRYMDLWFLMFTRTMVYINSAINPILYNAMSVKFRRAFKRILCCGLASNDQHTSVYSEIRFDAAMVMSRRKGSVSKCLPLQVSFPTQTTSLRNGHTMQYARQGAV